MSQWHNLIMRKKWRTKINYILCHAASMPGEEMIVVYGTNPFQYNWTV